MRMFILLRAVLFLLWYVLILFQVGGLGRGFVCISTLIFEESAFVITGHVRLCDLHLGSPEYCSPYNFHSSFFHIYGRHTQAHTHM